MWFLKNITNDEKYELNINNRLTETLQSVLLYICEYSFIFLFSN